jgi:hypothetical protein
MNTGSALETPSETTWRRRSCSSIDRGPGIAVEATLERERRYR